MYSSSYVSTEAVNSAAMLVATLFPLVVWLVMAIVFGVLTRKLARHKGYTGYFWTGFFLGLVGLVYVVGLPDRSRIYDAPRTQPNDTPLNP